MNFKAKSKVWLESEDGIVFGSGRAGILRAVAETGSLNKAAAQLGLPYRKVWSRLKAVEKRLGTPLMERHKGGSGGGGSQISQYAINLIKKYEHLEDKVKIYTQKQFEIIFSSNKENL